MNKAIIRKIQQLYYYVCFYISGRVPPPRMVNIDPINICNLRCVLCPTGCNNSEYPQSIMSYSDFQVIIDKLPFTEQVLLFSKGEPFLNPAILQMIRYAKEKGKCVYIETNFSIKRETSFFIDLVNSDLDYLTISLDGASQETYSKYRVGGDFELVMNNLKKIVEIRNRLNKKTPAVIWKFIVNRDNESEITQAKKMAQDAGVEFEIAHIKLGDESADMYHKDDIKTRMQRWLPLNKQYVHDIYSGEMRTPLYDNYCRQLFTTLTINPDGGVFPCCWLINRQNIFGNLLNESFDEVWNNEMFQYSRSLFWPRLKQPKKVNVICSKCKTHKKRYL